MFKIHLYNLIKSETLPTKLPHLIPDVFVWETCQRTLLISPTPLELPPSFKYYSQDKASQLLLEIVLGLHSKVLGETEVLGQFKNHFLSSPRMQTAWDQHVHSLCSFIAKESKRIRTIHLKNNGHITYGSLVNNVLPQSSQIDLIGNGQLARDILPWLSSHTNKVVCYARNPLKAQKELAYITTRNDLVVEYKNLNQFKTSLQPLIIAAPVENKLFEQQSVSPQLIVDLREAGTIPPALKCEVITLENLFQVQQENLQLRHEKKLIIENEAKTSIQKWFAKPIYRPLGWEDACLYA